jgi:hypothetical protein
MHSMSQTPPKNGCFTVLLQTCNTRYNELGVDLGQHCTDVAKDSHMLVEKLTIYRLWQEYQYQAPVSINYAVISNVYEVSFNLLMTNEETNR